MRLFRANKELLVRYRREGCLWSSVLIPASIGVLIGVNIDPWWFGAAVGLVVAITVWMVAGAAFYNGCIYESKECTALLEQMNRDLERDEAMREWSRLRR